MRKVDVLIAGAGPVGLTLGTLLGKSGITCLVIDKASDWPHESRAITMTARTLEHLHILNMATPMIEAGIPCQRISYYYKNHYMARADFSRLESPWNLVLHISQYRITQLLSEAMAKTPAQLLRPLEFVSYQQNEDFLDCQLLNHQSGKTETIATKFLIACDGGRSRVREIQGMPFPGEIQGETFLMTDVLLENFPLPSNERHYLFLPGGRGLLCILPLLGEDGSRIFRIITMVNQTLSYDDNQVLKVLQEAFNTVGLGAIKFVKTLWTTHFNPKQFVVSDFYHNHIAYAGDAAHTQSPIGSQGLNTGIQDAFNLAWRLVFVLQGQAPESFLEQYHIERHKTAVDLLNYNNLQRQRIIKSGPLLKCLVLVLKKLNYFNALNKKEIDAVSQLPLHYTQNEPQLHVPQCLQAGYRFPIHLFDKEAYQIYESQLEANIFLGIIWDNGEPYASLLQTITDHYPQIKMMVISETTRLAENARLIPDKNKALHKAMNINRQTFCLVRPDTYIAITTQGEACLPALIDYWPTI